MRAPERFDVAVVGAGPAGSAAAIAARDAGLDVFLVDKATFPRDKTCGDGLTTGALRLLERLGLELGALESYATVRETVLVSPSGRRVVIPLPVGG
ncbi:MAG: FAD-dependent monooxygenase, partial [Acidimicrobiia bacterium]